MNMMPYLIFKKNAFVAIIMQQTVTRIIENDKLILIVSRELNH